MISSGTDPDVAENKIANIARAMRGECLIDDGVVIEPISDELWAEYKAKQNK
jgi:hypothetical protein